MRPVRKNSAGLSAVMLLTAGLLAAALSACAPGAPGGTGGAPGTGNAAASGTSGGSRLSGKLTVFAAASLKSAFTRLADEFERRNPGTEVVLSFAGSSDLVTQISQGAPADVFASADSKNMAKLQEASLVGDPINFATNTLEIAVPPGNPASISTFADLARPGVKAVVCASQVPCGAAADRIEKATGTALKPVSEESSVTDVLGKVASGEADAGLVYVTDVKNAGDKVEGIPFPEASQAVNTYPVAAVGTTRNRELAAAFISLVTGSDGQKTLADAGFGAP
ncbi:molybdate ABC transporter substrate-binding protein [Arthrobacter sp. ISL-5]|uniref:molybdate ABC transporter substrate-binding protein n=1 Tax=Arthrobacter sp. ISL-5 TaxID=2819111 RepID=UPI001BE59D90|nr:molybdate ABC transporter substrate-binding protein [Arthrobacter sp. ISL-5]MBT2553372.1 molybdate ABC transporter substrate-binding protein [Arthrobacter sp. ISL-5]